MPEQFLSAVRTRSRSRSRSRSPRRPVSFQTDRLPSTEDRRRELDSPRIAPYSLNHAGLYTLPHIRPLSAIGDQLHFGPELPAPVLAAGAAEAEPGLSSQRPPAPSPSHSHLNPGRLAVLLYDACNISDKNTVLDIIGRRPPSEVVQITTAFEQRYGRRAYRHIRERLGGLDRNFVALLEGCAAGPIEHDAIRLYEALYKVQIDRDTVVEILAGRPPEEIRAIRLAYKQVDFTELDIDMYHRLTSPFKDLMMMVVDVDRRSPGPFSLLADVQELFEAGVGGRETEDLTIFKILVDRPSDHIRRVALEYQKIYGRPLEDDITSAYAYRSTLRRALKLILRSAISRPSAVAHMFEKALRVRTLSDLVEVAVNGSGADDGRLVRLMIENRDPATRDAVKRVYQSERGKTLSGRVREVVKSTDYLNAILVCLGERRASI